MKNTFKRTAFQRESSGEFSELYLEVYDFLKTALGKEVEEKHNAHTTSFSRKEGGYCSLRIKEKKLYLSWLKGAFVKDKYKLLEGSGKVSRVQFVHELDALTKEAILFYIQETLIILVEKEAIKALKKRV